MNAHKELFEYIKKSYKKSASKIDDIENRIKEYQNRLAEEKDMKERILLRSRIIYQEERLKEEFERQEENLIQLHGMAEKLAKKALDFNPENISQSIIAIFQTGIKLSDDQIKTIFDGANDDERRYIEQVLDGKSDYFESMESSQTEYTKNINLALSCFDSIIQEHGKRAYPGQREKSIDEYGETLEKGIEGFKYEIEPKYNKLWLDNDTCIPVEATDEQ